ncbi:MAG: MerR family transcriptional regulator [Thermodesulfobacteriota bacterium]
MAEPIKKRMRMKELVAVSGVPKATILFYIKEGLIPRPIVANPNMHYYTMEHVNAIKVIKELQTKRYLPLSVIRKMVRNDRSELSVDEIRTIAEMDGRLFRNMTESIEIKKATTKQLAERTGATLREMKTLERMGLLRPVTKGKQRWYEEDDIRFMECWKKLREIGFSRELGFDADVLTPHLAAMGTLVAAETEIMVKRAAGRISPEEMIRMVEGGTTVINTMIGIIRKRLILDMVKQFAAASNLDAAAGE